MTFFDKTHEKSRLIGMKDIRIIILTTYFPR